MQQNIMNQSAAPQSMNQMPQNNVNEMSQQNMNAIREEQKAPGSVGGPQTTQMNQPGKSCILYNVD